MFIRFILLLKAYGVKVTTHELLDLNKALQKRLVEWDVEQFYYLARTILVKDETQYDKFDTAFAHYMSGAEDLDIFSTLQKQQLDPEWFKKTFEKHLSDEEKAAMQGLGSLDALMEQLKQRLAEQQKRHAGGNKWIGTGGTSPFGAYGYHPEGIRIGQDGNRSRRAVKVWDKRTYKDLDTENTLSHRNIHLALKQLRKFAHTGDTEELDIDATTRATAKQSGWLDLKFKRSRENKVKVLILFDIGGSMDDYIHLSEELFSAAKAEFQHLSFYYFHNCVYESLWKNNERRDSERLDTFALINKYGKDYKLIFVGDATMGPYEIAYPGGSVEHWNEEPGQVWLNRLLNHFEDAVWLNPQPQAYWRYYQSIDLISNIMSKRMYPLTVEGLQSAIKTIS